MIEAIIFWILAAGVVGGATCVVLPPFGRNPLHAALALIGTFFCMAGIYVLLAAHLMAALQVIVYAGAVMVLFIFVIMLLNLKEGDLGEGRYTPVKYLGVGVIGLIFAKVIFVLEKGGGVIAAELPGPDAYGGVKAVGAVLLKDFLLPFELTSILLLVAIVGAVILAKKRVD